MRPGFDTYFLGIAEAVAQRSDCRHGKVGAVLVDSERRIISTGYPGVPPGKRGCLDGGCPRGLLSRDEVPSGTRYDLCPSDHRHAEWNCVEWAAPERRTGGWLYITRPACSDCFKYVVDQGITRIVTPQGIQFRSEW